MPDSLDQRSIATGRPARRLGAFALLSMLLVGCQPESNSQPAQPAAEAGDEAESAQLQEVTATVQTPTAGWELELISGHRVDDAYWCVFRLVPPAGMAAQVISEASETARFVGPDLPVRLFVLGKTWDWESEQSNVEFIDSLREIKDELADAETLTLVPN